MGGGEVFMDHRSELLNRLNEVPDTGPPTVTCGSGYRCSVVASLLPYRGQAGVVNVTGGMTAWNDVSYPISSKDHHVDAS